MSKAEQARINGPKSTGPKTPEGLLRCRQASLKHGLWVADFSTLPHEEQLSYAAILTSATDQFRPRNSVESAIVGLLVDAIWRSSRLGALANAGIDREMWIIKNQTTIEHEAGELHLLAEQASKSVPKLEARARHYTRESTRHLDLLKKLQNWPVSTEASQLANEISELRTEDVPEPPKKEPKEPFEPKAAQEPARKPVQSANSKPRKGSVPRRK
ncbi:MAG: hypothetical protein FJW38_21630 [Acidobacteria bacterium]|nr:hypothetical protein [Acidobacteriota bacterium]